MNLPAPRRILLVEDDLEVLHSMATLLRDMGHTVDYAVNGYVALDVARRFKPDVVLLDFLLPGQSGITVCEELRRDRSFAHVRIYLVSGHLREGLEQVALAVGCQGVYAKPLSGDLVERLLA